MNKEIILPGLNKYKLGHINSIEDIAAGDVNFDYKVITDKGTYVAKIVNVDSYFQFYHIPKKHIISSLNFSEQVSAFVNQKGVPSVCAIPLGDQRFVETKNTIMLVYPYVHGYALNENNILSNHVKIIATLLAKFHGVKYPDPLRKLAFIHFESIKSIGHNIMREKGWQRHGELLKGNEFGYLQKKLHEVNDKIISIGDISLSLDKDYDFAICHNDLKPKNVLWDGVHPHLIDWEGTSVMPRMLDYLDTMLSWCSIIKNDSLELDLNKCESFNNSYRIVSKTSEISNDVLNFLLIKWLAWLTFCLAKLQITTDVDNQKKLINYALNYLQLILDNYNKFALFNKQ